MDEYLSVNRANWDERAPVHAASAEYAVGRLLADPEALSEVVRFDLPRLGDISGLRVVHLQCHIGTDTLSLARLGAQVSGLDLSGASLREARALAASAGVEISYVQSDVYSALDVLPAGGFDLVYTGIGAICWLPSVARWAEIVASLLAPGGRLFLREGHPMLWALDSERGPLELRYPYFETSEALIVEDSGSYIDTASTFGATLSHSWNHGLGETISALLGVGMEITGLEEHDSVPWQGLPGYMSSDARGEWRLSEAPERLAASFTLQARRRPR